MSQGNVEIVRAAYEAVARRDRDAFDAIVTEHLAPDFEFEALLTGLTYMGATSARELVDDIQDTVGYTPEVLEAVDLDEHVLVVVRMAGRGSRSGVPVTQQGAVLLTFKADKIASAKSFPPRPKPSKPWGCGSSPSRQRNLRAKNSSAARVFVSCAASMSTPRPAR